jgi:hypothetical protein
MVTEVAGTTVGIGFIEGAVNAPLATFTVTEVSFPTFPLISVPRALRVKVPAVGSVQL